MLTDTTVVADFETCRIDKVDRVYAKAIENVNVPRL